MIAFAQYEDRPLLGAVELFRGLSMQVAYRWATGRIMAAADDRAVLLWSVAFHSKERQSLILELLGASTATLVGLVLVAITSAILLLPLWLVVVFTGEHGGLIVKIGLAIVIARWLVTTWRAIHAYRDELALTARLPDPKVPRWRIDFLGAVPARRGFGGQLLGAFLARADDSMTEVVLHCEKRNVAFYRTSDFERRTWPDPAPNGSCSEDDPAPSAVGASDSRWRAPPGRPVVNLSPGEIQGTSSANRARTRRSISSTIGRTSSTDFPAGSSSSQST